jgi:hypothetical protein
LASPKAPTVGSARSRASLPFIACGDVVMDPLRGEIIHNLIQNYTKTLFRYSVLFPFLPL